MTVRAGLLHCNTRLRYVNLTHIVQYDAFYCLAPALIHTSLEKYHFINYINKYYVTSLTAAIWTKRAQLSRKSQHTDGRINLTCEFTYRRVRRIRPKSNIKLRVCIWSSLSPLFEVIFWVSLSFCTCSHYLHCATPPQPMCRIRWFSCTLNTTNNTRT